MSESTEVSAPAETPSLMDLGEDYVTLTEDGGLKKKIIKEGHGEMPPVGSKVNVHYVGTLLSDGSQFDSSRDRQVPFSFELGAQSVIKGWDEGVATMKVGEIAELICAPEYGYGAEGSPPKIPKNAVLKFEVEMIDFTEPLDTPEKKIAAAQAKKEEGNKLFKEGDFAAAKLSYEKGKEFVEDMWDIEPDQQDESRDLTIVLGANITMCCLKLGDYAEAIKTGNEVLKLDPNNVKTIWRLGMAYMNTGEYETGLEVVENGLKVAPEDANLKSILEQIHRKQAEYQKKEKSMYGKMFNGI